jgi:DNA-binding protein Fis
MIESHTFDEAVARHVEKYLPRPGRPRASEMLGIHRHTLRKKLHHHGLR